MNRTLLVIAIALAAGTLRAQAPAPTSSAGLLALAAVEPVAPAGPDDEAAVAVVSPGPDTLVVAPGGTVGFGVQLTERAGQPRTVRIGAEPLAGWRTLITRPVLDLGPGSSTLQLVSLQAPGDAEAGLYTVDLWVRPDGEAEERVERLVRVPVRESVDLLVTHTPRYVTAGDAYDGIVLLSNAGNAPTSVTLALRSTERHIVDPASVTVEVPAGGSVEIPVRVQTVDRPTSTADRLLVEARVVGRATLAARTQTSVEVIPRTGAALPDHTWPLVAAVSAVSRDGTAVPLVGLAGQVPLDPGGRHQATLMLAGLGQRSESVYAGSREWWAAYDGPAVQARVGTGSYSISPATASSTFGAGARVRAEHRGLILAAHVRRPLSRSGLVTNTDAALMLGTRGRLGELSLNALAGVGPLGGRVLTGRVQTEAVPRLDVDAEGGLALGRMRPVYSVRATADLGRLAVSGTARRRDQSQPGRYTSYASRTASGRLAIAERVSGRLTWRQSEQDAGRGGTLQPTAENMINGEVEGTRAIAGIEISGAIGAARERRIRADLFDRRQTSATGRAGLTWRNVRFRVDGELGRVVFSDDGRARPTWTARASMGYMWRAGHVTGYVESSEGGAMWDTYDSRRWVGGVSGGFRLGKWLGLQGGFDVGEFRVDTRQALLYDATASARLDATARLPAGRELAVGTSLYRAGDYRADNAHVTLRVPLHAPLPYQPEVAQVRGRFVHAETGAGVGGLIVLFGEDRVVTDRDGAFAFDALPAGGYLLIDRSTLSSDLVPLTPLPLRVRPGAPVVVEVGRRVSIQGALRRVDVLGAGVRADTVDVGGVPHLVIEAEGQGQRHRTVTDDAGRFSFADLPAGVYTLRVVHGRLPDGYRLETETRTLEVREPEDLEWRVVPERQEIRILRGGTLRPGGSTRPGRTLTVRPRPDSTAETPASPEPISHLVMPAPSPDSTGASAPLAPPQPKAPARARSEAEPVTHDSSSVASARPKRSAWDAPAHARPVAPADGHAIRARELRRSACRVTRDVKHARVVRSEPHGTGRKSAQAGSVSLFGGIGLPMRNGILDVDGLEGDPGGQPHRGWRWAAPEVPLLKTPSERPYQRERDVVRQDRWGIGWRRHPSGWTLPLSFLFRGGAIVYPVVDGPWWGVLHPGERQAGERWVAEWQPWFTGRV